MSTRTKTVLTSGAKFIVPVAIIAWLLWRMEPEQWSQLREQPKNYWLLTSAMVVALLAVLISFVRWWLLVRCQGITITIIEALRLSSIGFLLSFVSAGSVGGDLFKAVFLARRCPGKRFEAIASVVVDRAVGLLGLVLLLTISMAVVKPSSITENPDIARIYNTAIWLTGIGFFLVLILVLGGTAIDRIILTAAKLRVVGGLVGQIAGPLRMFHRHPFVFVFSVLMGVVVHALLTVSIYMIAKGLYTSPPSLADHSVIVPLANVAAALPIAPAGLGVTEAAMEWLYKVIPADPTVASGTLVALIYEIVKVLMAIIGVIFYWSARRDMKGSMTEELPRH